MAMYCQERNVYDVWKLRKLNLAKTYRLCLLTQDTPTTKQQKKKNYFQFIDPLARFIMYYNPDMTR
jgi:hypothetical protein